MKCDNCPAGWLNDGDKKCKGLVGPAAGRVGVLVALGADVVRVEDVHYHKFGVGCEFRC